MHFAVGMAGAGALATIGCALVRRGWRFIPLAMTLGGFWAIVPDMPRLFRQDFPGLGLGGSLGSLSLERGLHAWGDLFFFHAYLDDQANEYALHGLILMILLYNLAIALLLFLEYRQRRLASAHMSPGDARHAAGRAWGHTRPAHKPHSLPASALRAPSGPESGARPAPDVRLARGSHLSRL